ncbi:unknown [Haloarcula marismortui ATCC 43049]|uniref:Uncharacterized protein n=1 Tax=Haloarcula marismortui (strain ATCC 43049 / DSM 3752 / JCM 8966 / VKM B-1809) TaxID=272569 RepID=Q5V2R4_HALMA|nr:hypothetical protein [Haloarcula marismortui]AAV46188.1 unknown [Haloarcula marismortui ATCC 43049]QCP90941.1 hypothetical protein E6P14_08725 [Haloarcula marismortui ATCC 43049]
MVANERGQLLLIGGVAIAIVVFSTILFAHSLAVTDGITTTGSADTIERSADREASVERDLGRLAAETRGDDLDEFEARYENALQNYTETHNRVVGGSGGAYLNATLNESASNGTEVNQTSSSRFNRPGGTGSNVDWDIARSVDRAVVFNLTVTRIPGVGQEFIVKVEGDSGDTWKMVVTEPGNKEVAVTPPSGSTTTCSGAGDADVDLLAGTCDIGGTPGTFPAFTETLDAPYTVSIEKGNRARGTYRFAAIGNFPGTSYDSGDTAPYPVVPAVDLTYDTPSASYNRTVLVEVDDG